MSNSTIISIIGSFKTITEKVSTIECGIEINCVDNSHTVVQSCDIFEYWKGINFGSLVAVIMIVSVIVSMIVRVLMAVQGERECFSNLKYTASKSATTRFPLSFINYTLIELDSCIVYTV